MTHDDARTLVDDHDMGPGETMDVLVRAVRGPRMLRVKRFNDGDAVLDVR